MSSNELLVSIRGQNGQAASAEVLATSLEDEGASISVHFSLADAPSFEVGEEVRLLFSGAWLRVPMEVPGRVIFGGRTGQSCHFRFLFGLEAHGMISSALNRREAVRVHPSAESPVEVSIRTASGRFLRPGTNDLSVSGLALLIDRQEEAELAFKWDLPLSLQLPGEDEPMRLVGLVRYRRLAGSKIYYGIEFDEEATEDYEEKARAINNYVVARQREMLNALQKDRDEAA